MTFLIQRASPVRRFSIALFIIVIACQAVGHAQSMIDKKWWLAANAETRRGAISGTFDCLTSQHGAKLPKISVPKWSAEVDAAFGQSGSNTTLATTLLAIPKESGRVPSGGEDYGKEKHGWFDGYYWGSASDDERYGFLIGYLSCGNELRVGTKRVAEYRSQIDFWYEGHPSSNARVVDVLALVRQHGPKSMAPVNK